MFIYFDIERWWKRKRTGVCFNWSETRPVAQSQCPRARLHPPKARARGLGSLSRRSLETQMRDVVFHRESAYRTNFVQLSTHCTHTHTHTHPVDICRYYHVNIDLWKKITQLRHSAMFVVQWISINSYLLCKRVILRIGNNCTKQFCAKQCSHKTGFALLSSASVSMFTPLSNKKQ